jgi:hypothetical protein
MRGRVFAARPCPNMSERAPFLSQQQLLDRPPTHPPLRPCGSPPPLLLLPTVSRPASVRVSPPCPPPTDCLPPCARAPCSAKEGAKLIGSQHKSLGLTEKDIQLSAGEKIVKAEVSASK